MERDNLSENQIIDWAKEHGGDISNVIDDPRNESIRSLIFSGDYKKAAVEIIKFLNK